MPDHSSLQFQSEVLQHFAFLQYDFGFAAPTLRATANANAVVCFESDLVYVHVSRNARCTEVILLFGRKGIDDQPGAFSFGPGDLISLETCRGWHWNEKEGSSVSNQIEEFARLLRTCGKNCLLGDVASFAAMKQTRLDMIAKWKETQRITAIRRQAEDAWQRRDYAAVIALYSSLEGSITPVETARLSYARKKA